MPVVFQFKQLASLVVPVTQVPCDVKKYPLAHVLHVAAVAAVITEAVEQVAQLAVTLVHMVQSDETKTYPEIHNVCTVALVHVEAPVGHAVQEDVP